MQMWGFEECSYNWVHVRKADFAKIHNRIKRPPFLRQKTKKQVQ